MTERKHGGARPGAGRKRRPKPAIDLPQTDDALAFLLALMNCREATLAQRVRAAIAALQYTHVRMRDGGIGDLKRTASKDAARGKFAPGAPPLRIVKISPLTKCDSAGEAKPGE